VNLFCYGSLQFDEVMRAVTGREFAGEPAELDGFARYRFRDATYPGLAPEAGASTEGTLFRGLDGAALEALDRFEGARYERVAVEVRTRGGGSAAAQVYVVCAAQRDSLSREAWDKTHFRSRELDAFLRRLHPEARGEE
jgi:gamma-glutamylcyclotransferase (GGCT)/AIG2-like uncharacterized protein YtfP